MGPMWRRLAVVVLLAACFSDRPTGPTSPINGGTMVDITNFEFVPPTLSVPPGTVVTWTNSDNVDHTASSDDDATFDSGLIGQNGTFQFTAGAPGTYGYFCRLHPFMKGTLTVTP